MSFMGENGNQSTHIRINLDTFVAQFASRPLEGSKI